MSSETRASRRWFGVGRLDRRSWRRSDYLPMGVASAVTVAGNMATGVLTARLLAPSGKGAVAAIVTWGWFSAYVYHLGLPEAATYSLASSPRRESEVTAALLASTLLLSLLGLAVSEIVLPLAYARQSAEFLRLARTFVGMSVFVMFSEAASGLLAGQGRFGTLALLRVTAPVTGAAGLILLALSSRFSLTAVLVSLTAAQALAAVLGVSLTVGRTGVARPCLQEVRALHRRALRIWPGTLATLANGRLDLLLLPAFASTGAVGLYSVAANAASVLQGVAGNLSSVLLTQAARLSGSARLRLIERSLSIILLLGLAVSVVLAVFARPLIVAVYGPDFLPATPLLVILLPGVTAWTVALFGGRALQSLDRPGQASVIQIAGAALMIVGLPLTLPQFGVVGAAWTSTVAYLACFGLAYVLLARAGASFQHLLRRRGKGTCL